MKKQGVNNASTWLLNAPGLLGLLFLFAVPTLMVILISFRPSDLYGGTLPGWTIDAWTHLASPGYSRIIWRTIWMSLVTTGICLFLGIPIAYFIARQKPHQRRIWLILVILPFWSSLLVRILAWKVLLHPEGLVKRILVALNLAGEGDVLMYHPSTVLVVMVYSFLPFAILPLYSAAEKFDFSLIDAARDLGASSWRAFRLVFFPGISHGIAGALLMVLIPALGSYIIPDLVGGPTGELLGNKIAQRTFNDHNLPLAAALSTALILAVLVPLLLLVISRLGGRRQEKT